MDNIKIKELNNGELIELISAARLLLKIRNHDKYKIKIINFKKNIKKLEKNIIRYNNKLKNINEDIEKTNNFIEQYKQNLNKSFGDLINEMDEDKIKDYISLSYKTNNKYVNKKNKLINNKNETNEKLKNDMNELNKNKKSLINITKQQVETRNKLKLYGNKKSLTEQFIEFLELKIYKK